MIDFRSFVAGSLMIGAGLAARAEDLASVKRVAQGLRERRLYTLADRYCRERLGVSPLSDAEQAQLTIEWIRCCAEQAMNLPAERRARSWQRARQIAADFAGRNPDNPQRVLVQLQDCLTLLAQGEQLRMEAEISPSAEPGLEPARDAIRQGERGLEKLLEELTKAGTSRAPAAADALSAQQIKSLAVNVRYQYAVAFRSMANCYPPGSADRIAALQKSLEQLQELLRRRDDDPRTTAEVRLDQIACLRLLGDNVRAKELLAALPADSVPAELQARRMAEKTRLAIQTEGPERALSGLAAEPLPPGAPHSAELDFARLEAVTASWQTAVRAKDDSLSAKWREQALAAVRKMEHRYGGYWGRRAELLLLEQGRGQIAGSADMLERTANEFYIQNRFNEAITAYDEAADAARKAGNAAKAFESSYRAALVQQNQRQFQDAARRFRQLALADASYAQADNAHLLAIINQAQAVAADPNAEEAYSQLLDEHLRLWPAASSTANVWLWKGKWHESHRRWKAATQAYRQIPSASSLFGDALGAAARCWSNWLDELRQDRRSKEAELVASEAADFLENLVASPDHAEQLATTCRLQAARLRIEFTSPDYRSLETMLAAAGESKSATPEQKAEAQALLAVALAGQPGREAEAGRIAASMAKLPETQLWLVLQQAMGLAEAAGETSRRSSLAAFALQVLDRIDPEATMSESRRMQARQWRALANEMRGNRPEAIRMLKELALQFPDDLSAQETLGSVLLRDSSETSAREALDQWRRIAARTHPGGEPWFRAKYNVALAQLRSGDKAAAARLIRYMQATENLNGSGWQARFEALLRECGN
jgi:hypothetical protein